MLLSPPLDDSLQSSPRLVRLAGLLDEFYVEATAANQAYETGTARGPRVDFSPWLSRELGGYLSVGLHAVHGSPGCGKSALVGQLAATAGCPALFVSCEMSVLELLRRQIARATHTQLNKLRTGALSPSDALSLARRTVNAMPDLAFADATKAPISIGQIREFAQATRGDSPHMLVVVDSLHAWTKGAVSGQTGYDRLNEGIELLRQLAAIEKCAVIVSAERNRGSMGDEGLNSSKGTSDLEYTCDTVLALGRAPKATCDANGGLPVTLTIPKNRAGAPGYVDLQFFGAFMEFRDASRES